MRCDDCLLYYLNERGLLNKGSSGEQKISYQTLSDILGCDAVCEFKEAVLDIPKRQLFEMISINNYWVIQRKMGREIDINTAAKEWIEASSSGLFRYF